MEENKILSQAESLKFIAETIEKQNRMFKPVVSIAYFGADW